ncbi:CobW family GTP-binding protein [Allorhizocola rhizosphaerae]|uniref:CobW family GTP-binding protein n=1 Tax=Allorhizocola rhizosphaerae TaxID=1872709 RepID=UPI000E3D371F|nr:GTP-binding protein [Allorhizocola rhizosphaerae]
MARVGAPPRVAATVVSGFRSHANLAVAMDLLAVRNRAVLVRHDLRQLASGVVRRFVRTRDAVLEDETVHLVHGCVACTLREDLLPTMVRLARADPGREIVLVLPEAIEPDMVAGACAHCVVDGDPVAKWVRIDSYVSVVDAETFLSDLDSGDDLVHRDMQADADDHRSVAAVVARQVEFADTIVLSGAEGLAAADLFQLRVLLHRLAPWAAHVDGIPGTGRSRPDWPDAVARGLEGYDLGVHEPASEWGVTSVVFQARRPMHPQRLHDALPWLATETLRSRGHVWLATQPDLVLGWESAGGGVALGGLGRWLAALPEPEWEQASPLRRAAASLRWDPYYGDRDNHLALVGIGVDPDELHQTLTGCLLTDAELALGQDEWSTLPDPFAGCFEK